MIKKKTSRKEKEEDSLKSKEKELTEELKRCREENNELVSHLQMLQAEFENFRKREESEKERLSSFVSADIIKRLLPILDEFSIALRNNEPGEDFVHGIEMIHQKLVAILKSLGLKEIKAEGRDFDPELHEAVMQVKGEKDGVIEKEFQKGYLFKDRVIRHSKVAVIKAEEKESKKQDKGDKDGKDKQ